MGKEEKDQIVQELMNETERLKKILYRLEKALHFFSTKEVKEYDFLSEEMSTFLRDSLLQIKYDAAFIEDLEKNLPYLNSILK